MENDLTEKFYESMKLFSFVNIMVNNLKNKNENKVQTEKQIVQKEMQDKTTQTELNEKIVAENEEQLELPSKSIENFYNATERYSMMSVSKLNHAKKLMVDSKKIKDSKLFLDEVIVSPSLKKTLSEYLDGSLENVETFNCPNKFSKTKSKELNVKNFEIKTKNVNEMNSIKDLQKKELTEILNKNSKKLLKNVFCKFYSKNKINSAKKNNSANKNNSAKKSNLSEIKPRKNRILRRSIINMKERANIQSRTRTRARQSVKKMISKSRSKTKRIIKPKIKLKRLRKPSNMDYRRFRKWDELKPEINDVEFDIENYSLNEIKKIFMKRLFLQFFYKLENYNLLETNKWILDYMSKIKSSKIKAKINEFIYRDGQIYRDRNFQKFQINRINVFFKKIQPIHNENYTFSLYDIFALKILGSVKKKFDKSIFTSHIKLYKNYIGLNDNHMKYLNKNLFNSKVFLNTDILYYLILNKFTYRSEDILLTNNFTKFVCIPRKDTKNIRFTLYIDQFLMAVYSYLNLDYFCDDFKIIEVMLVYLESDNFNKFKKYIGTQSFRNILESYKKKFEIKDSLYEFSTHHSLINRSYNDRMFKIERVLINFKKHFDPNCKYNMFEIVLNLLNKSSRSKTNHISIDKDHKDNKDNIKSKNNKKKNENNNNNVKNKVIKNNVKKNNTKNSVPIEIDLDNESSPSVHTNAFDSRLNSNKKLKRQKTVFENIKSSIELRSLRRKNLLKKSEYKTEELLFAKNLSLRSNYSKLISKKKIILLNIIQRKIMDPEAKLDFESKNLKEIFNHPPKNLLEFISSMTKIKEILGKMLEKKSFPKLKSNFEEFLNEPHSESINLMKRSGIQK